MKTPPLSLHEILIEQIAELHASEKKYLKSLEQLSLASSTKELRAALSSEKSQQDEHVSRLALILEALKLKPSRISNELNETLLKLAKDVLGFHKQHSLFKDIQILQCAKLIFSYKASAYSSLQHIAINLGLDMPAKLLEQSFADSQNNYNYLLQVEQNVIYPEATK